MVRASRTLRLLLAVLSAASFFACTAVPSPQPATQDVAAIFTQAYMTLSAERTRTAAARITETPTVADAAVPGPSATRPPVAQSACDNAGYVGDMTIPDGTIIAAGSSFTKTWKLQNTGACPWTASYRLSFVGGERMSGADGAPGADVPSGGQTDVSVQLVAPAAAGTYTGQWQMRNAQQQPFGVVITVVISVGAPVECKRSSKTTITIMGHAGPENTTIDFGMGTTVTDQHGDYAFQVPQGWSGTVTPSKAKVNPWSFTPAFRTYSNVQCDLRNENYKATAPPGV